mgnify:CR=1 FL=1
MNKPNYFEALAIIETTANRLRVMDGNLGSAEYARLIATLTSYTKAITGEN